jgi:hypothetical protein
VPVNGTGRQRGLLRRPAGMDRIMMTDYQLQPTTRRCCLTGRELQPGEKFYSVLFDEGSKFVRKDYSLEAWQGPPEGAFSFWVGRITAPDGRRKLVFDDEMLQDCFQRLEGDGDPAKVRFRYVLALLMMRRRRLRFEEAVVADGREVLALRCARTGARYRVVNPCLTEEEIASVQEEVFRTLGWE